MAILNLIAGGYYNRLGNTVGQRWKNKRVVRAFVIPRNPQTELQQSWRGRFSGANRYAQIAMRANRGAPCWYSPDVAEWGARVGEATTLLQGGASPLDLIPLVPSSYIPEFVCSAIAYDGTDSDGSALFRLSGVLPDVSRSVSLVFGYYDESSDSYEIAVFKGSFSNGSAAVLAVSGIDVSRVSDKCIARVVSSDDSRFEGATLYSVQLPVSMGGVVSRAFDTTVLSAAYSGDYLQIKFAESYTYLGVPPFDASVSGVWLSGSVGSSAQPATFVNLDGYFALQLDFSGVEWFARPLFPSGSMVSLPDLVLSSGSLILTIDAGSYPISGGIVNLSGDLSYTNQSSAEYEFVFASNIPSCNDFTAVEGSISLSDNYLVSTRSRSVSSRFRVSGGQMLFEVGYNSDSGICVSATAVSVPSVAMVRNGATWTAAAASLSFQNSSFASQDLPAAFWGLFVEGESMGDYFYLGAPSGLSFPWAVSRSWIARFSSGCSLESGGESFDVISFQSDPTEESYSIAVVFDDEIEPLTDSGAGTLVCDVSVSDVFDSAAVLSGKSWNLVPFTAAVSWTY